MCCMSVCTCMCTYMHVCIMYYVCTCSCTCSHACMHMHGSSPTLAPRRARYACTCMAAAPPWRLVGHGMHAHAWQQPHLGASSGMVCMHMHGSRPTLAPRRAWYACTCMAADPPWRLVGHDAPVEPGKQRSRSPASLEPGKQHIRIVP